MTSELLALAFEIHSNSLDLQPPFSMYIGKGRFAASRQIIVRMQISPWFVIRKTKATTLSFPSHGQQTITIFHLFRSVYLLGFKMGCHTACIRRCIHCECSAASPSHSDQAMVKVVRNGLYPNASNRAFSSSSRLLQLNARCAQ